jgi:hypothetical protein
MVRCRLDGGEQPSDVRYVPAAEFFMWRHFMTTRHHREVSVDETSVWVPEAPGVWDEALDTDRLEAVLRVRFEKPGPRATMIPVERYFPVDTFPQAKAALLAHFDPRCRWTVEETPGYFIAASALRHVREHEEDTEPHPEILSIA